jgi:hypothetical protein
MMYLQSGVFEDTEFHVQVGAPICLGVTLTPVTPAVADRFFRLCSAKTVDSGAATAHLIDNVRLHTKEQVAARQTLEKHVADAQKMLEEAQQLAALPVHGDEVRAIAELDGRVEAILQAPLPPVARIDRLRRYLPMSVGLDPAAIGQAIEEFDSEIAALRRLRDDLARIRLGLIEAARVARDPATLVGLDKMKANVRLARALTPERVASLQQATETLRSMLAQLDSEVGALAKGVE